MMMVQWCVYSGAHLVSQGFHIELRKSLSAVDLFREAWKNCGDFGCCCTSDENLTDAPKGVHSASLPETNIDIAPENLDGWNTTGSFLLGQTAHFQVRLLLVSGRVNFFVFTRGWFQGLKPLQLISFTAWSCDLEAYGFFVGPFFSNESSTTFGVWSPEKLGFFFDILINKASNNGNMSILLHPGQSGISSDLHEPGPMWL